MKKAKVKKFLKTVYLGLTEEKTQLHSANLTYYTLFAIVPIFALFLTISEYFNFHDFVQEWLLRYFSEQPEMARYLITFAHRALQETQNIVMKLIGILLLLWAAIKMLLYIDISINQIWHKAFRPKFLLRNARFLIMLLVCPILFLVASGASLYISMILRYLSTQGDLLEKVSRSLVIVARLFPSLITFFLLSFLYYFVPYAKIPFKNALITGFIAGVTYQIVQYAFFSLQIALSAYSATYGTFAAFPLFLTWLNLSWIIFFMGGKLCFVLSTDR